MQSWGCHDHQQEFLQTCYGTRGWELVLARPRLPTSSPVCSAPCQALASACSGRFAGHAGLCLFCPAGPPLCCLCLALLSSPRQSFVCRMLAACLPQLSSESSASLLGKGMTAGSPNKTSSLVVATTTTTTRSWSLQSRQVDI